MTTLTHEAIADDDVIARVRAAAEATPKRATSGGFSLLTAAPLERMVAPALGLYLGYAVVRLPEVFAAMQVAHLPMILMLGFIGMLGLAIPPDGWSEIWRHSLPLKIVLALFVVGLVTAPVGVWPSESYEFLRQRYVVSIVIFVSCVVFLRDRRNLRVAAMVYVLCGASVSYNVVHTYDANGIVYNEDGDPIDPDVVAARPELRRLTAVGVSLDSNDFGAILATTFPLALWLSVGSFRRRVFWSSIAGLMVVAVVPTQSRGSELGFIAAAAVIVAVGARGWRRWLSGALILACVGVFVAIAAGIGAGDRFSDFGGDDYNVSGNEGRLYFWRQGMVWMLKRPWGYGISNFPTYFGMLNGEERAAHSSWVQYGMELGVMGLVLFVALCYLLIRGLRELRKRAALVRNVNPVAKEEEILAAHMLAVMAGVLVTGSFLSNAYYPLMYMSLGMAGATLLGNPLRDVELPDAKNVAPAAMPGRRMRAFPTPSA